MSRFYVASQRFSNCKNYQPWFSSYVEEPEEEYNYICNIYYSMILILLGWKDVEELRTEILSRSDYYMQKDKKRVLKMVRDEKATISSLHSLVI